MPQSDIPFREPDDDRPSAAGVLAISIAALLVTLGALGVLLTWDETNIPGSLALDVGAIALALWVDSRALLTWHRRAEQQPPRG